jgi:hypothetical protein
MLQRFTSSHLCCCNGDVPHRYLEEFRTWLSSGLGLVGPFTEERPGGSKAKLSHLCTNSSTQKYASRQRQYHTGDARRPPMAPPVFPAGGGSYCLHIRFISAADGIRPQSVSASSSKTIVFPLSGPVDPEVFF